MGRSAIVVMILACSFGACTAVKGGRTPHRAAPCASAAAPRTDANEIEDVAELRSRLPELTDAVVQGVDLGTVPAADLSRAKLDCAVFLGGKISAAQRRLIVQRGGTVVRPLKHTAYDPYRARLYTQAELDTPGQPGPVRDQTLDQLIYDDYKHAGKTPTDFLEAEARSLHDQSIDDALEEWIRDHARASGWKGIVGIMGASSMKRDEPIYRDVARTAYLLTRAGYLVATGGGTGAMEAGSLGAFMARQTPEDLERAIDELKPVIDYKLPEYVVLGRRVRDRYRKDASESLSVPTWFYGHEPTNAFGTAIAKYFSNGIREDRLLQIASRGLVVAKGSAGTRQEIFMDAAQNHYATYGHCAPMVFLGRAHFEKEYDAVVAAAKIEKGKTGNPYGDLIGVAADPEGVVRFLDATLPYPAMPDKACVKP